MYTRPLGGEQSGIFRSRGLGALCNRRESDVTSAREMQTACLVSAGD